MVDESFMVKNSETKVSLEKKKKSLQTKAVPRVKQPFGDQLLMGFDYNSKAGMWCVYA